MSRKSNDGISLKKMQRIAIEKHIRQSSLGKMYDIKCAYKAEGGEVYLGCEKQIMDWACYVLKSTGSLPVRPGRAKRPVSTDCVVPVRNLCPSLNKLLSDTRTAFHRLGYSVTITINA